MLIQEVIWLEEVEDKIIQKHGVLPEAAEQILSGQPHIRFMERGHRRDEDLYAAFGQTEDGRYLVVYFIMKPHLTAFIVSARDMTAKEKKSYGSR